jgi:hypothetical protein
VWPLYPWVILESRTQSRKRPWENMGVIAHPSVQPATKSSQTETHLPSFQQALGQSSGDVLFWIERNSFLQLNHLSH